MFPLRPFDTVWMHVCPLNIWSPFDCVSVPRTFNNYLAAYDVVSLCQIIPSTWQICLSIQEHASDLAELSICQWGCQWFWQNCLYMEERASDLAELHGWGGCQSWFAEFLPVCGGVCQWFGRIACMLRSMPVIWQNCLCQLVGRIVCLWTVVCQWFGRIAWMRRSVPVIWQNCLYVEEHAINVLPVIWQNCLCRQCFGRIVCLRTVCQWFGRIAWM